MAASNRLACIFLGAPGSGKGTQAKKLEKKLKAPHISTGDMLRQEIDRATPLGLRVKEILAAGKLVDDATMLDVLRSRFAQPDVKSGFILDGYPRNIKQAEALEQLLSDTGITNVKVVYLSLKKDVLVQRLVGRLSCTKCGSVFHKEFNKPKKENVCDYCGTSPLQHRKDDSEDTAVQRLEVFEVQTAPLIEFYKNKKLLIEVNASQSMDQVEASLEKALGSKP